MKCPHIWRKYFEVTPIYVKTGRKWWQFWLEDIKSEKRIFTEYKECQICHKMKFVKDWEEEWDL